MKVKDVKQVLRPLNDIYEIGKVFVGAIPTDKYDFKFNSFEMFLEDIAVDELEVIDIGNPVDYDVHGFRFIEEIDIWIKEEQND